MDKQEKQTINVKWKHKLLIFVICIALNVSCRLLTSALGLPVWLDIIGTCIVCYYIGIIGGVLCGGISGLFYCIIDPLYGVYAISQIIIALVIGVCVKKKAFSELAKAILMSFWLGILNIVLSVPINLWLLEGLSGNKWGDALFDMLSWHGIPVFVCSLADEAMVDIIDKQVCIIIAFILIKNLDKFKMNKSKKMKELSKKVVAVGLVIIIGTVFLYNNVSFASPKTMDDSYIMQEESCENQTMDDQITQDASINNTYTDTIYNNTSGLMSSEANSIAETEDGSIWIGSYAGLTRYDGSKFEFITQGGIASVNCMMTDSKGRLWIGTNDSGIARYENGEFTFFSTEDGLPVSSIRSFAEKEDGTIYVGTTDRTCRIGEKDEIEILPPNLTYVNSMAVDDEYLYMVSNSGKLIVYDENDVAVAFANDEKDTFFTCVAKTSNGIVLGTSSGRVCLLEKGNKSIKIKTEYQVPESEISSMNEDSKGNLWLCAENYLGYIKINGSFSSTNYKDFNNSMECSHEDYQGNLWFASSRYGVLKLSESQFSNLFSEYGIEDAVVNAVVKYNNDWYCASDNGLVILNDNEHKTVENELTRKLVNQRIRCLMVDKNNHLWISTYGGDGLICYDGKNILDTYNMEEKGTTSDRFRCTIQLEDGTVVAGTSDGINFIQNGKVVSTLTDKDGLTNTQILSLLETEDGTVYAGSDGGGIYVIKDRKIIKNYTTKDGLSSDIILRIVPLGAGYLVVTSNALVYLNEDIKILSEFPYFNNFDAIVEGDTTYVLSSAGIYEVNTKGLLREEKLNYRLYSSGEGLFSSITVNSWNGIESDGNLYFCSNTGVICFDKHKEETEVKYKFGISSISCDNKKIYSDNNYFDIPSDTKKLEISGSVKNYYLSNIKVKFYLGGKKTANDDAIYNCGDIKPITISSLSGGRYSVHMQILDSTGTRVLSERTYVLYKKSQMWEKMKFKIYLIFIILESFIFFIWTIIDLLTASKRKKELEDLKVQLENTLNEKTSQLKSEQEEKERLYFQTIMALGDSVDAKDEYTSGHSKRVATYGKMLAQKLGKDEEKQQEIYRAGLLHDVGKIRIPEDIINKPGKLSEEEYEIMKIHPVTGYHILKNIPGSKQIAMGAKSHHERFDGKGYPNGIEGYNIPEVARILGVADAYDAMTSDRSYRKALPQSVVRKEIEKGRGTQFDPDIADVMLTLIDEDKNYTIREKSEGIKTILVVDDEVMVIKLVEFILKDNVKYDVISAKSGKEALDIIDHRDVDMVLLDVMMPEMDGLDTLTHIREKQDMPVVFMTADKNGKMVEKAAALGVEDYLTKPFLPLALKEVLHAVLKV